MMGYLINIYNRLKVRKIIEYDECNGGTMVDIKSQCSIKLSIVQEMDIQSPKFYCPIKSWHPVLS